MAEYLTTRELAELLRIKERKVYDLAATGTVPCSKATGKLLFPRAEIDLWLSTNSTGHKDEMSHPIPHVFLGSHDPLLEWSLRESQCGIPSYFDGSLDGIVKFVARQGIASGLHVQNSTDDDWNTALVSHRCAAMSVVLIEWAKRTRGLIVSPAVKNTLLSINDLPNHRLAVRQDGAGSQQILSKLLATIGIQKSHLTVVSTARSELDAATSVLDGTADVAFGLESLAHQYQLPFIPVVTERFDIVVDRRTWFEQEFQMLIQFCRSGVFLERAKQLKGYDCSCFGQVHYNSS